MKRIRCITMTSLVVTTHFATPMRLCAFMAVLLCCGEKLLIADSIVTHARVSVIGVGMSGETALGGTSASLGPYTTEWHGNGNQTSTVAAGADALAGQLIRLNASSSNDNAGYYVPYATAIAGATWQDITYLNSVALPLPSSVRLHFFAGATFEVNEYPVQRSLYDQSFLRLALRRQSINDVPADPALFAYGADVIAEVVAEWVNYQNRISIDTRNPWWGGSSFTWMGGPVFAFSGEFDFDVPYNASFGGYPWAISAAIESMTANGYGILDFGNSLRLEAITNTDGSPLTGYDISFDSGMQVPEPSTFFIFCAVLSSLLAYGWRRRKSAA
jgi:hypothetical protein